MLSASASDHRLLMGKLLLVSLVPLAPTNNGRRSERCGKYPSALEQWLPSSAGAAAAAAAAGEAAAVSEEQAVFNV